MVHSLYYMRSCTHQTRAVLFAENDPRNNNKDDETSAKYPQRYDESIRHVGEKEAKRKKACDSCFFTSKKFCFDQAKRLSNLQTSVF
jgi:hypothetical protein